MDLERIEALLDILTTKQVSEFSYEDETISLQIRLGAQPVVSAAPALYVPPPAAAPPSPAAPPRPATPDADAGLVTVSSPMPGTFYRASSPDAAPYVQLGDRVKKGQVLCIVEAMKMMNELESETEGVIAAILVDNTQPVQFGQALFKIRPS